MNHQMAEKRHCHSYDPTDVGCGRCRGYGEGTEAGAADSGAKGVPFGPQAPQQKARVERGAPHSAAIWSICTAPVNSPSAGLRRWRAALQSERINLQRAGCVVSFCLLYLTFPRCPRKLMQSRVSLPAPYAVKFTHPNCWSSLAYCGALSGPVSTSRTGLINLKFLHLPMPS